VSSNQTPPTENVQLGAAILIDRSRDLAAAGRLVGMEPDDRYHTTDHRLPLSRATLAPYDVLVIAGHSRDAYNGREVDAIAAFVRRGGGLLLAASTGVFERYAERPPDEMALQVVARRFGIEFLSPGDAAGRSTADADLVEGYSSSTIRLHKRPPLGDVRLEDVRLDQWSPVRARSKKRRAVLMSHRKTGEAAAVAVRFGRGRIVAVGGVSFLRESRRLCRHLVDYLAAGSPGRGRARKLRYQTLPPRLQGRAGGVEIAYSPSVAGRLATLHRIVRRVVPHLEALAPAGKKKERKAPKYSVEFVPGCFSSTNWHPARLVRLGADQSDAALAFALGARCAEFVTWRGAAGRVVRESVLGDKAICDYVGLAAMRVAGFEAEADRLGAALERDSRRRFKGLDAAWYYPDSGGESPGLWLWLELERRCGRDILGRFLRAFPDKPDWSAAPRAFFTGTDVVIHFLSRAARTDLYPWFAEIGTTVHPLPRARFGSKPFRDGVRRALWRFLRDGAAPASERADAVEALIACQRADKKQLGYAVRQLKSRQPLTRLVGAARLVRVQDQRAQPLLRELAKRGDDRALAAIAALLLVEHGDQSAAATLARHAEELDVRFQLDAGHQLGRIGDPRATSFALAGIQRRLGPGAARLKVEYGREVRVFPTVNGQPAANIFACDGVLHMPENTHVSMHYVDWVHTAPRFRRKGLARLAMQRTFDDVRARRCACATLGTGTRNVAHALYRSFGFVDVRVHEELKCTLADEYGFRREKGLSIRPYRPGDETAMARLFNDCYRNCFASPRKRPARLSFRSVAPPHAGIALLARRGNKLAAYVVADIDNEGATIRELAAAGHKRRDEAAAALMTAFHRRLKRQGVRHVSMRRNLTDTVVSLLQPLGYRSRRTGSVSMFAILDLPQFLEEVRPLLEHRLEKFDWSGTIALRGERLRAGLEIENGRVTVHRRVPGRADIMCDASDATITRFVAGIHTPFEPYLQLDLSITPLLSGHSRELLEALFPRLDTRDDYW